MREHISIQCDLWDGESLKMVNEQLKPICKEKDCPLYWFMKAQPSEGSKDPLASSYIDIGIKDDEISSLFIHSGFRSIDEKTSDDIETFIHVPPKVFCALVKTFKNLYNHKINIKQ